MKFKVWCKDKNEWEKHLCVLTPNGDLLQKVRNMWMPISKENHIIVFWTGLKDKNGKEIYEGDIVYEKSWWWGPGYVILKVGDVGPCHSPCVMSWVTSKDIDNPEADMSYNLWEFDKIEVIGNLYESPHLLNNEKRKFNERKGNKINISDLSNYDKEFKLEARSINGTLIAIKDNNISCRARVIEAKNEAGISTKGIISTEGSCLWIPLNDLNDWIIEATEL